MTRPASVVYYDVDCGICTATIGVLRCFDWRRRVVWTPFQSLDRPPRGLSWDDLHGAIQLVTAPMTVDSGFYAFRKLLTRLPLLAPVGALMWIPGVDSLGVPVYQWIARNRYRLSSCAGPRSSDRRLTKKG